MIKVGLYIAIYPGMEETWSNLPPLGLGYLSAYVKKYMSGVEFVVERNLEDLIAQKPDIVGFSFVTHTMRLAARQALQVKAALGCPVLCGGPHVTTLPTVLEEPFDIAVLSEGEQTFLELMQLYQAEKKFDPRSLRKIKGILYRDEARRLVRTEPRPFMTNLDEIPYPDRDLTFSKWPHKDKVEVQLLTGRGCPYSCSFCSTIVHWGRKYRSAGEKYVLDELELIRRKYNPGTINFYDDLFTVNRKRTLSLMKGMRERGIHEGVEFTAFVRSNLLDDELMEGLAKTNFKVLSVGFESGSDNVLKAINKTGAGMEQHRHAIELGRKHGLLYNSCFILGAPGETRNDILETFDFVNQNTDVFYCIFFTPLMVFPGTEVWEWAKAKGISDTNLTGVAVDVEDFEDGMGFLQNRWPYFNEENIPREEMISYLRLGTMMNEMLSKLYTATKHSRSADYAAQNIPFTDIVKEKARRRIKRLMPSGRIGLP